MASHPLAKGSAQPALSVVRGLVLTPTAAANLARVEAAVDSGGGMPLLLEGATGVGKSATIMAAAHRRVGAVQP